MYMSFTSGFPQKTNRGVKKFKWPYVITQRPEKAAFSAKGGGGRDTGKEMSQGRVGVGRLCPC